MNKKFLLFDIINEVCQPQIKIKKEEFVMKDKNSLTHSAWNCKYQIVFTPKYSVASIMGYLEWKSSLMIFDRHANYKYKYGIGTFGVEAIMWIQ